MRQRAKAIVAEQGVTRPALEKIVQEVERLASREGFWNLVEFPCIDSRARQTKYLLDEDEDHGFALYAITWLPGMRVAPHNHTTWACIAAAQGAEENSLYERTDGGTQAGSASIVQRDTRIVSPGSGGLALLPDDIHAVRIAGDEPTIHLHLYGRALETLDRRLAYDIERGSCAVRGIGVPSVRRTPSR